MANSKNWLEGFEGSNQYTTVLSQLYSSPEAFASADFSHAGLFSERMKPNKDWENLARTFGGPLGEEGVKSVMDFQTSVRNKLSSIRKGANEAKKARVRGSTAFSVLGSTGTSPRGAEEQNTILGGNYNNSILKGF